MLLPPYIDAKERQAFGSRARLSFSREAILRAAATIGPEQDRRIAVARVAGAATAGGVNPEEAQTEAPMATALMNCMIVPHPS